jgi:hypothetical protein
MESVNLSHGITIGIINIRSNIIQGGKFNKRVFYYSVELFCLILLDYPVRKMYQPQTFSFLFFSGKEFLSMCNNYHELITDSMFNFMTFMSIITAREKTKTRELKSCKPTSMNINEFWDNLIYTVQ